MSRAIIWILLATCVAVIVLAIIIANAGLGPEVFTFLRYIPGGDKTGHLVAMGTLSLLTNLALSGRTIGRPPIRLQVGTLLCLLVVTLEECSQMFITSRSFGFDDLAADFIGIIAGGWLAWLRVGEKNSVATNPNQH